MKKVYISIASLLLCGSMLMAQSPANRMRYGIVRHKQAVGIFVVLCILLGGFHRCCKLVCVHCPGVGKGNIVQGIIRQSIVHRAGNTHCREVKVIGAAGFEGKLL